MDYLCFIDYFKSLAFASATYFTEENAGTYVSLSIQEISASHLDERLRTLYHLSPDDILSAYVVIDFDGDIQAYFTFIDCDD